MEIILSTKKTIKNTFTFDDAVAKEIADSEQTIAQLQDDNKQNTESKNGLKLRQYAELIPMLAKAEYLKKNKFFMPQVRKEVDLHLDQTCKVSKASRKRLIENTNAFIRTVVDPKPQGSNFTADAFKEWCKDNSVNSETKLKKKILMENMLRVAISLQVNSLLIRLMRLSTILLTKKISETKEIKMIKTLIKLKTLRMIQLLIISHQLVFRSKFVSI